MLLAVGGAAGCRLLAASCLLLRLVKAGWRAGAVFVALLSWLCCAHHVFECW
jgi:hypothetical protein